MFVLTDNHVRANEIQSCVAAGCSILACGCILLCTAWVHSVPTARNLLDRISFRLIIHALCFEIMYDISYIVVVAPGVNGRLANGVCATGVYFMMAGIGVVNYHITSIAVNLAVTIVFGLNPSRLKLEQWYMAVSMFVGFFVPIIPAALGHFGWDPVLNVCWIKAGDHRTRMRNLVLDLYLWQLLSCFIASVAVILTLVTLFRQGRATSRVLFSGDTMNLTMSAEESFTDEEVKPPPIGGPIGRIILKRRKSKHRRNAFGHLEDRFVRIAIRIAAYPICLVIVNGIIAIGDLYLSATGGVKSRAEFGLYSVYYFFYGARGLVFASICVFVDPCLRNGVREAWAARKRDKGTLPQFESRPFPSLKGPLTTQVESDPTVTSGVMDFMQFLDDGPNDGKVDLPTLAQADSLRTPPSKWAFWSSRKPGPSQPSPVISPKAETPGFSHEFAGVPLGALPSGLTDDANDVVQADILLQARAVDAMERILAHPASGDTSPIPFAERLKTLDKLQRRVDRGPGSGRTSATASGAPSHAPTRPSSPTAVGEVGRPQKHSHRGRRPSITAFQPRRASITINHNQPTPRQELGRRDRAQELAQKLYEELQSQL